MAASIDLHALNRIIRVREQIDLIDEQIWDMDTRLSLAEICDIIIDLMRNDFRSNRTGACNRFTRTLNELIKILNRWKNNTINFRDFVGEQVDKAEEARNRGNETQILWTGVNCLANGAGLVAVFVPGLNVPLIIAGVGGSLIGVWKSIKSDKKNKKEFADIMNEIEGHDDYKMISFSDVITQMQRKFEENRDQLMVNFKFDKNAANIVATLQMIIQSMLKNLIVAPQQQQGIQTEMAMNITSQIENLLIVAFQAYGRHVFNLMDDAFQVTVGTAKGLSFALVAVTFVINFKQLLNETKDRAEKVRKVTKMKDKLQSGADSIQFFINTMQEIREQINSNSRAAMEAEMKQMREKVEKHDQMFRMVHRLFANNAIDGNNDNNLQSIDFTET